VHLDLWRRGRGSDGGKGGSKGQRGRQRVSDADRAAREKRRLARRARSALQGPCDAGVARSFGKCQMKILASPTASWEDELALVFRGERFSAASSTRSGGAQSHTALSKRQRT